MNVKKFDKRLEIITISKEIVGLIVSILGYTVDQQLSQIRSRTTEDRVFALSRGVNFKRKRKYDQCQVAEVMKKKSQGD